MADYNSSLPVRTQTNGDVAIFIADGTTPSQVAAVDTHGSLSSIIRDASGNAVTSQANGAQRALDVGINVAGVQIDPRSIRALTSADVVTAAQGTAAVTAGAWPIKVTDGTNVTAVKPASTAAAVSDPSLVVALSPNSPLPAGTANIGKVSIQDSSGTAFSASNPLFVTLSDTVGVSVDNYNTAASLAAAGTSNHDYTVTAAKTFYLKQIWATASGKLKIEVQLETGVATNVFNSFWVGFNSTATPNIVVSIPTNKTQVAGAKIRIIRTNEDKAAMDVYSTVSGTEQ